MCGFSALIGEQQTLNEIETMLAAIKHRGPDEQTIIKQQDLAVGVCRLSIIGAEFGRQPYRRSGTSQFCVFNGEIYNFRDLARYLAFVPEAAKFSDTALFSELFWQTGFKHFSRIDGMFAALLWDDDHAWVARDAIGIKPLYFSKCGSNRCIRVSSEAKGIINGSDSPVRINMQTVSELDTVGFQIGAETIFESLKAFPSGTVWEICRKSREMRQVHFFRNESCWDIDKAMSANRLSAILKESIESQLRGVSRPFLALSGGFDSTVLAQFSHEALGRPIESVTASPSPQHPDTIGARSAADADIVNLNIAHLNRAIVLESLPEAIWIEESPSGLSAIPMLVVARKAAELGARIVLSGEGADELFCGYTQYIYHPTAIGNLVSRTEELSRIGVASTNLRSFADSLASQDHPDAFLLRLRELYLGGQLQWNHLAIADRYFMSAGIECRVPYLAAGVVAACRALKLSDFINHRNMEQKAILRCIARKLGGISSAAVDRRKIGFPSAVSQVAGDLYTSCLRHYRPIFDHEIERLKPLFGLEALLWDIHHEIFIVEKGSKPDPDLTKNLIKAGLARRYQSPACSLFLIDNCC
ncbi:asparagine synthetase B family protein [Brucella pituitosa]|uniref:asparagine synthetase B family protein n=1 Tax=Brucella pituitosa TaxID=571256 RepID=UPI0009A1D9DD|nr:asparagine synthetase B [Brucella pituitosa]